MCKWMKDHSFIWTLCIAAVVSTVSACNDDDMTGVNDSENNTDLIPTDSALDSASGSGSDSHFSNGSDSLYDGDTATDGGTGFYYDTNSESTSVGGSDSGILQDSASASDSSADSGDTNPVSLTGSLSGVVKVNGKTTYEGVSVTLIGTDRQATATTEGDGGFTFEDLVPGSYTVSATLAGYTPIKSNPVQVVAGNAADVDTLILDVLKGSMSGRFLLDGASSHSGISVTIVGTSLSAKTDGEGYWLINNVPVGNYTVKATFDKYQELDESGQTVVGGQDTAVPTKALYGAASISGKAVLSDKGNGFFDVHVVATLVGGSGVPRHTYADTNTGKYEFDTLAPGTWNVTASYDGYVAETLNSVEISVMSPATDVNFSLNPALATLKGKVTRTGLSSHEGIVVKINTAKGEISAETNSQGTWQMPDVPVGTYQVAISAAGFVDTIIADQVVLYGTLNVVATINLEFDESPREIEIVSGNNQQGIAGEPLAEPFTVKVLNDGGYAVNASVVFQVSSDNNGELAGNGSTTGSNPQIRVVQTDETTKEASVNMILGTKSENNTIIVSVDKAPLAQFTALGHRPVTAVFASGSNGQLGTVGQMLAQHVIAEVQDDAGNAIGNVPIQFNASDGGSPTSTDGTVVSDMNGRVETPWTLGGTAGAQTMAIQWMPTLFTGKLPPIVLATANASAKVSACTTLERVSPSASSKIVGPIGRPLTSPLIVLAKDVHGNVVENEIVQWAFAANEAGQIMIDGKQGYVDLTDAGGESAVVPVPGEVNDEMTVIASGCGTTVAFTVGGAAEGTLSFDQTAPITTVGTALVGGLSFTLSNGSNQPQVGVAVDVSIDATYDSTHCSATVNETTNTVSVVTDSAGKAYFSYEQGCDASGVYEVVARVKGNGPSDVISIGATPANADKVLAIDGDGQHNMRPCQPLSDFVAAVMDEYDNAIADEPVSFYLNNTELLGTINSDSDGIATLSGMKVDCDYPSQYAYKATAEGAETIAEFEVTVNPDNPSVDDISQKEYNVGNSGNVTIEGGNFEAWSEVWVNGQKAELADVPGNPSSTAITFTMTRGMVNSCVKPTIQVKNYNGINGVAAVDKSMISMRNVTALEYDLAWPGFAMEDMAIEGYGLDAMNLEGILLPEGETDPNAAVVSGMAITSVDANSGTLDFKSGDPSNGEARYDFYLVDGSGELCEPVPFDAEFMWPDTGQDETKCANPIVENTEWLSCSEIAYGETYYGQDGHFNDPRRVHNYTENQDGTITDNLTGLVWQQQDAPNPASWSDAVSYCDSLNPPGANDWRLPEIHELWSILNLGTAYPAVEDIFDISQLNLWAHTSLNTDASSEAAWYINAATGESGTGIKSGKADTGILCVKGEQMGFGYGINIFDNHDGTFSDYGTGLMWSELNSLQNWEDALATCAEKPGPYNDWRLPDRREVETILALDPGIDNPLAQSANIWTSTRDASRLDRRAVWVIETNSSGFWTGRSATEGYSLLFYCVRDL
ncbi:MAG: carboxypeptidase regulatory-like domain-containing protein [Deltaproteobacteria bacterium]|nr:carboxypeptidase regulatory-like domain-containing protein [Deltaproteobacteria bacterium]